MELHCILRSNIVIQNWLHCIIIGIVELFHQYSILHKKKEVVDHRAQPAYTSASHVTLG